MKKLPIISPSAGRVCLVSESEDIVFSGDWVADVDDKPVYAPERAYYGGVLTWNIKSLTQVKKGDTIGFVEITDDEL